jgi:hypothetical protein
MTLTIVVVGLVLAPPTGWLLGAWLADLTQGALALVLGRPGHRRQRLVELRARSRRLARPIALATRRRTRPTRLTPARSATRPPEKLTSGLR